MIIEQHEQLQNYLWFYRCQACDICDQLCFKKMCKCVIEAVLWIDRWRCAILQCLHLMDYFDYLAINWRTALI